MKIVCDNCSTKYSIADEKVRGKVFKIKCKKCSHIIVVKGTEGAPAEGAAPPQGFDQKETRVFDYSGFDGPGGAAPPGGEAVWHLVIDREQVGPLSLPEIQAKWNAGDIDADTYGWKEGFGDWQRIGAIDDFAFLSKGGGAAAPAGGGEPASLFGASDAGSHAAPTGRSDPADLFAAAASGAGAGADEDGPGDLFGGRAPVADAAPAMPQHGAPQRKSVPKDDLFAGAGGAPFGGEDAQSARGGGGGGAPAMTGQRNENSVLFSLNNLASLATETAPKSSSSPTPGFASSAGSEGSGLIDIRAMAAITLGKRDEGGAPRGGGGSSSAQDDLPVFSPSAFAAPQAVLLPGAQQRDNKLLYILISVVAVLLIAAVVLVVVVLKSGNKNNTVAANDTKVTAPGDGDKGDKPPENPDPNAEKGVVPPDPNDKDPKDPGTADPKDPGTADPKDPGVADPKDPGNADPKDPKKPRHDPRATHDPKEPREPKEPKEPKDKEPKEPKQHEPKSSSCDEVGCAIDPSQACCPKKVKKDPDGGGGAPEKLTREDIQAGLAGVRGRVNACNDKYKEAGTVTVKIQISAEGSVSGASVEGKFAGTPTGSCVETAVKGAHFKKAQTGVSVKYPFVFR